MPARTITLNGSQRFGLGPLVRRQGGFFSSYLFSLYAVSPEVCGEGSLQAAGFADKQR